MTQVWRAHAKVNLGLRITGVRADGYHEIDSLFVSVDLHDLVTVEPTGGPRLAVTGPAADGVPVDHANLALRAATTAGFAVAEVTIEKHIPAGAGLGGASADAAAVLHALGQGGDLALGAQLGADVPFCMTGGTARVTGVGDVIAPMTIPGDMWLVLVVPDGVTCSTAAVYAEWDRGGPGEPLAIEIPGVGPVANDLAGPARRLSPELDATATALERVSGRPWLMTGSGSGLLLPVPDGGTAGEVAHRVGGRPVRPVVTGVSQAPAG